MQIVFRFDANAKVGQGHLIRSSVLAQNLAQAGHQVTVLSQPLPEALLRHVEGGNIQTLAVKDDGLAELRELAAKQAIDWIVVDHYGLDAYWEGQARALARRLLVIDDLANRAHDCDVLLDQNVQTSVQRQHRDWVPASCRLWMGLDHLLARDAFYEPAAQTRQGLLVFLGGGDQRASLARLLAQLTAGPRPLHLLLTSSYGALDDWRRASGEHGVLHMNLHETAALCGSVAGALVRCGFIAYELALLGTPMVILYTTPIQREVALALQEQGHGIALAEGELDHPAALTQALANMQQLKPRPMNRYRTSGAKRVVQLMETFDD